VRVRIVAYSFLAIVSLSAIVSAQPVAKAEGGAKTKKDVKPPVAVAPKQGIKTPGVQIPFASLKAEAELATAAESVIFTDAALVLDPATLYKVDTKKDEKGAPATSLNKLAVVNKPCGSAVSGFNSLWVPNCGDQTLVRLDSKTWKTTATITSGTGSAKPAVAMTADSIWMLSDDKTTLSRVDPDQNLVVAEIRLGTGCNTLTFGEAALWVTCPAEDRVLRIDPNTELVTQRIEVSAQPKALAIGETSIWVLCQKAGKVERIDPKTNKIVKTIDLGVTGAEGSIAIGLGSVWVTMTGFPVTRIDPQTDKVVQQFWGAGGGAIHVGLNSVWLSNLQEKTLWRLDPKRIAATLAE
jgi:virginiamycin B lyase